jgi:hypothetical protein
MKRGEELTLQQCWGRFVCGTDGVAQIPGIKWMDVPIEPHDDTFWSQDDVAPKDLSK